MYIFRSWRTRQSYTERERQGAEELEDDAFSICVGFLFCQSATFILTSHLYPVAAVQPFEDQAQIPYVAMVVVTVCFALYELFWGFNKGESMESKARTMFLGVKTISMFLAWCCIRWGELVFWSSASKWAGAGDPVVQRLMLALSMSVLILFLAIIMPASDFSITGATMALVVGQTWMFLYYRVSSGFGISTEAPEQESRVLMFAQQAISPRLPGGAESGSLAQVALLSCLAAILIMAWKSFVMPKAKMVSTQLSRLDGSSESAVESM
jgi:hypothetical protein